MKSSRKITPDFTIRKKNVLILLKPYYPYRLNISHDTPLQFEVISDSIKYIKSNATTRCNKKMIYYSLTEMRHAISEKHSQLLLYLWTDSGPCKIYLPHGAIKHHD